MKRQGRLFEQIIDPANIRHAWLRCLRGKRRKAEVIRFSRDLDDRLREIHRRLSALEPQWGDYESFVVREPKTRIISAVALDQRIMHHAIMNVLEPIFDRHLVYHTYACRKGKGTHAAVRYALRCTRRHAWFVKLDVRRYFDTIDHLVLKSQLRRLIKDGRVLYLLDGVIDSYRTVPGKGLPIGNLTSQFFANHYLSSHDHTMMEREKAEAYLRYMDDMVMYAGSVIDSRRLAEASRQFCAATLQLELKEPVIQRCSGGVAFLGFLVRPQGIYLTAESKRRFRRRAVQIGRELHSGAIDEAQASQRANGVNAALLLARSRRFRATVWHGADLGHEPDSPGRQLEQQRLQLHGCQPEQQQPAQPEQQQRVPRRVPLSPAATQADSSKAEPVRPAVGQRSGGNRAALSFR